MTFAALLSAQDLVDAPTQRGGSGTLRALLPVAGMTIIEQQAERARAAGARRLMILVDGVPAALTQACDRMRARGSDVELIRDGADIADLLQPNERLLLVADGLVAGDGVWSAVASARDAALLVTSDTLATRDLERLDPETRWGGLAMLGPGAGERLRDLPEEWDPLLAALRQAGQDGVPRLPWDASQFAAGELAIAGSDEVATLVEQRIIATRDTRDRGWGERWLIAPVIRLIGGWLLARPTSGLWARGLGVALLAGGTGTMLAGAWLPGVLAAWSSFWATGAARFVARFRPEPRWAERAALVTLVVGFGALALAERGASIVPPALGDGGVGVALLALFAPRVVAEGDDLGHPDVAALLPAVALAVLALGHDLGGLALSVALAAYLGWRWFIRS